MKFDLNLLQQALAPLPYIVVGDELLLLAGIERAKALEDGSLLLNFGSSQQVTLSSADVENMASQLKQAIHSAHKAGNLIQVPKLRPN